ncbi:MAG: HAMP domain-containing sensor histidine kinase [Bacteroidaceae bacterium]
MNRVSTQSKLFLLLLVCLWTLVVSCVVFQYSREKQFKAAQVNSLLLRLNTHFAMAMNAGETAASFYEKNKRTFEGLRLTVIQESGRVVYDSYEKENVVRMPNHAQRPEVKAAMCKGNGYAIKRFSESVGRNYFYSALRNHHLVLRSAIPYDMSLSQLLRVDNTFLYIVLIISIVISIIGYLTSRLFTRLQRAAQCAAHEHERVLHEQSEKVRIKRQLTNNINHELKTPICAIHGYLELLLSPHSFTPVQTTDFLKKSFSQAERLRILMNDLSTITRLDEASDLITREGLMLNKIVEDVMADVWRSAEEQHITLSTNMDYAMPIFGNRHLLSSIFRNLADNAIAYSGARNIWMNITAETDDSYELSFSDNGIGVEQQHLPYIFERFYRVDKGRSRKIGGTGLGLSIVKNAVTFHGGTIVAQERERGGLTFVFSLCKN